MPKNKPNIVEIPKMNYIAVRGKGNPNDEPATVELMHETMENNGYELDISDTRYHHEIYLSDPRKCDFAKLKTVIRHSIKKIKQ
ncbi:MAG: GyrI-like domain-containing protein, partial [Bacilli bacterium]